MRASWSSTSCELTSSLLVCRELGGEMLLPLLCEAMLGSGGRGIAGGGEGREAADELLRRFELSELLRSCELSWLPVPFLSCNWNSVSYHQWPMG